MIPADLIERELQTIEARRDRPFSPSARRVLLEAAADQAALIGARVRRLALRGDTVRSAFFERVLDEVDFARYERLQEELMRPESLRVHGLSLKYLNLDYWLASKLEIALELGLHAGPPLAILDIGVGPGHFPFICRLFGHQVVGTDLPRLPVPPRWTGPHLFDRLVEVLGVDRREHAVRGGEPLPDFGRRFDLVTSLMVKFDNPRREPAWEPADWRAFLDDLAGELLAPGGRVYLLLNRPFASDAVMDLMERAGGRVDRAQCSVLFDPLTVVPHPADAVPG